MTNTEKEYILRRLAWYGNLRGIKKLVKEVVNPFAKDKECFFKNKTALQVAKQAGHDRIVEFLLTIKG
jgi:transcriptional regulator with PAS, ATPase and Fis domain